MSEALANEMDTSDEECEGRPVKEQKMAYQQTKEEWDGHMRTHGVFRKWCPFCAKGKCKAEAHERTKKLEEELEQEISVISLENMDPKSGEDKAQKASSEEIVLCTHGAEEKN